MNRVESFLEVNFENGNGRVPLEVYFNGSLYGVEGFSCLAMTPVSALGFGYLFIYGCAALAEKPSRVYFLQLRHEADGAVFGQLGCAALLG